MGNSIGLPIKHDYIIENDSYVKRIKNDRDYEIEIGDRKTKGVFYPQMKTKIFNNLANFSIRLIQNASGKVGATREKLSFDSTKERVDFFEDKEGFKFSLTLKEKPEVNRIRFSVRAKGLKLCKEAPCSQKLADDLGVTLEELKEGRPERVENSISVWYTGHQTDHPEFKTGKAFHIFRPLAVDSVGDKIYCDIDMIGDEQLVITIPSDFWKNAKYPIFIDPKEDS